MPTQSPYILETTSNSGPTLPFSVTPSCQAITTKYRNINLLSIDYAFRPRLRIRLTLDGVTWSRNPWIFGGSDSHTPYRYSCRHQLLWDLQHSSRYAFVGKHNALLPPKRFKASVYDLAPLNLRRRTTGPVSYYAFFKGWLLLSQPPGCQSSSTTFTT